MKKLAKIKIKYNPDLDIMEINGMKHDDSRIEELAIKINQIIDRLNHEQNN